MKNPLLQWSCVDLDLINGYLAGRLQKNPEASQRQIATPNKLSPVSSQIQIALPGLRFETEKLKTLPNLGNSI